MAASCTATAEQRRKAEISGERQQVGNVVKGDLIYARVEPLEAKKYQGIMPTGQKRNGRERGGYVQICSECLRGDF